MNLTIHVTKPILPLVMIANPEFLTRFTDTTTLIFKVGKDPIVGKPSTFNLYMTRDKFVNDQAFQNLFMLDTKGMDKISSCRSITLNSGFKELLINIVFTDEYEGIVKSSDTYYDPLTTLSMLSSYIHRSEKYLSRFRDKFPDIDVTEVMATYAERTKINQD